MYWTFDSIEDFCRQLDSYATTKRQLSKAVARAKDRETAITEATIYEFIAQMLRSSNLFKARLVLVDDDISEGMAELAAVSFVLQSTAETLTSVARDIEAKRGELAAMPQGELPAAVADTGDEVAK